MPPSAMSSPTRMLPIFSPRTWITGSTCSGVIGSHEVEEVLHAAQGSDRGLIHAAVEARFELTDELNLGQRIEAELGQAMRCAEAVGSHVGQAGERGEHPQLRRRVAGTAAGR